MSALVKPVEKELLVLIFTAPLAACVRMDFKVGTHANQN